MAAAALCYAHRYASAREAHCRGGDLNACDLAALRASFEAGALDAPHWGCAEHADSPSFNATSLGMAIAKARPLIDHSRFIDSALKRMGRNSCGEYHSNLTDHTRGMLPRPLPVRLELADPPPRPVADSECVTVWPSEAEPVGGGALTNAAAGGANGGDGSSTSSTANDDALRMVEAMAEHWLRPFADTGVSASDLDVERRPCRRILVVSGRVYFVSGGDEPLTAAGCGAAASDANDARLINMLRLVRLAVKSASPPLPDFELRLCVDDFCKGLDAARPSPIFTMVSCETSKSIPAVQWNLKQMRDVDWSVWDEALARRRALRRDLDASWDCRLPKAVWRGDASEHKVLNMEWSERGILRLTRYSPYNWRRQGRLALVYQRCHHGSDLNVRMKLLTMGSHYAPKINLTKAPDYAACVRLKTDGPMRMSLGEQASRFQMVVHVEGNGGWADRLRHLLLSGMVVLKQASGVLEWWEPLLRPWVHFVPVSSDLQNLTDAVAWVRQHPLAARNIATAAAELVEKILSTRAQRAYVASILRRYARLYRGGTPRLQQKSVMFECFGATRVGEHVAAPWGARGGGHGRGRATRSTGLRCAFGAHAHGPSPKKWVWASSIEELREHEAVGLNFSAEWAQQLI